MTIEPSPAPIRRRRRIAVASVLVFAAVALVTGGVIYDRGAALRVGWRRLELERAVGPHDEPWDPDLAETLDAALDALAALGEPGWAEVEAIAFERDLVAKPGRTWTAVRQAALDRIWARATDGVGLPDVDSGLILEIVLLGRGLERPEAAEAFASLGDRIDETEWVDAAVLVMLTDTDPTASAEACRFLVRAEPPDAAAAIRAAAETSPHPRTRYLAAFLGVARTEGREPDADFIRPFLDDPAERLRVEAASWLILDGDAVGVPILVDALRAKAPAELRYEAALGLEEAADPRTVAALVDAHDGSIDIGVPSTIRRRANLALEAITGHRLGPSETWGDWWHEHRDGYPPQLVLSSDARADRGPP